MNCPEAEQSTLLVAMLRGFVEKNLPGELAPAAHRNASRPRETFRRLGADRDRAFGVPRESGSRRLDILSEMASMNLARVAVSVTSLDRKISRSMEPRAPTPERRLEALKELSSAGIPTAVMAAPLVPALTDHELEGILERAHDAGVRNAAYIVLRLPLEIKDLFEEWLQTSHPGRAKHVMSILRSMRQGKAYDAEWGKRMTGTGTYAELIAKRVKLACERLGLHRG